MASAGEEAISPSNIVFEEKVDGETKDFTNIPLEENPQKKKKQPRRILHFSDGILEEYSTDEEEEEKDKPEPVDPKTLSWLPWLWFYFMAMAVGALAVADYCGEKLAWFFGITTPKYQYAIDEYHRLREIEEEDRALEEKSKAEALKKEGIQLAEMEDGGENIQVTSGKSEGDANLSAGGEPC